jgi:hypothetical protein
MSRRSNLSGKRQGPTSIRPLKKIDAERAAESALAAIAAGVLVSGR